MVRAYFRHVSVMLTRSGTLAAGKKCLIFVRIYELLKIMFFVRFSDVPNGSFGDLRLTEIYDNH